MSIIPSTQTTWYPHVAMLDAKGVIVSVNQAWRDFAMKNSLQGSNFGIGQNYVEMCERATGECAEEAHAVAEGIRQVIQGQATHFTLVYPCETPEQQHLSSTHTGWQQRSRLKASKTFHATRCGLWWPGPRNWQSASSLARASLRPLPDPSVALAASIVASEA